MKRDSFFVGAKQWGGLLRLCCRTWRTSCGDCFKFGFVENAALDFN